MGLTTIKTAIKEYIHTDIHTDWVLSVLVRVFVP